MCPTHALLGLFTSTKTAIWKSQLKYLEIYALDIKLYALLIVIFERYFKLTEEYFAGCENVLSICSFRFLHCVTWMKTHCFVGPIKTQHGHVSKVVISVAEPIILDLEVGEHRQLWCKLEGKMLQLTAHRHLCDQSFYFFRHGLAWLNLCLISDLTFLSLENLPAGCSRESSASPSLWSWFSYDRSHLKIVSPATYVSHVLFAAINRKAASSFPHKLDTHMSTCTG